MKRKVSFEVLVEENKKMLFRDKKELEKIYDRIETRTVKN